MTALVARRLPIDLEAPIAARCNGGDAFRTAFFNALSMSFPVGEPYFIDALRGSLQALPEAQHERFATEVKAFIGQDNLRHDGALWRWSTWRSGWTLLLARDGMFRTSFGPWRDHFARNFHPSRHDAAPGAAGLRGHANLYTVV